MNIFLQYLYFLLCTATVVIAILAIFAGISSTAAKAKQSAKGKLTIKKLNDRYRDYAEQIQQSTLSKTELKQLKKQDKLQKKKTKKDKKSTKPKLYVLNFTGDIRASDTPALTESINALLTTATDKDHVLVKLESGGGMVPHYGLAASQLQRIKQAGIKLTVAIDKVAASGGYMMACVANNIIAAPFAIIGSIGVVVQMPNLHRYLKKKDIDFEQLTAGPYKRTLTMLGENTKAGRAKMQTEIDETHELFKQHILDSRPSIDIDEVATGEHWYGQQAINLNLIDRLQTSDDYLLQHRNDFQLYEIGYKIKQPLGKKLVHISESLLSNLSSANSHLGT